MLILPFDNANVANFLNFSDIGASTLKQSSAFAKIRANSKLFNTNIVTNADHFALKYAKINELAFGSGSEVEASNYGSIRQHNLTAAKATLNNLATCLNEREMLEFLTSSASENSKKVGNLLDVNSSLGSENFITSHKNVNALDKYLNYVYLMNDSTDVKKIKHIFNVLGSTKQNNAIKLSSAQLLLNNSTLPTSVLESFTSNNILNRSFSSMRVLLKGANSNILTPDQLVRNYPDLKNGFADYNLSNKNNPIHSLIVNSSSQSVFKNSLSLITSNISLVPDSQTFAKL